MPVGKDTSFSDSSMDIILELAAFMWNIQDNVLLSGSFLVMNLLPFVNCFLGNQGQVFPLSSQLYRLRGYCLTSVIFVFSLTNWFIKLYTYSYGHEPLTLNTLIISTDDRQMYG